jgi:hypothetical protein
MKPIKQYNLGDRSVDNTDGSDMKYTVEVASGGMIHTKSHDNRFRQSSNTKGIT